MIDIQNNNEKCLLKCYVLYIYVQLISVGLYEIYIEK